MRRKSLFAVLLGLLMAGMVAGSAVATAGTPAGASGPSDPWETWAKQHTVRVLVVEKIQYKNGELIKQVEYTGNDLKAKFGIDRLSKVKIAKMPATELPRLYPKGAKTLASGIPLIRTYYKTTVLTTGDEPYPWWENYPYLPRWTWEKIEYCGRLFCHTYYEKADPVNLVWEGGTKDEVKNVLKDAGWHDWVVASDQYIYDPPQYGGGGWEEGDDLADAYVGFTGRYHVRLWVIYNGKVIGSAHHDTSVPHGVDTFEEGEDKVAGYYSSPWSVCRDCMYLYNEVSGKNDGYATIIWKG